MNFVSQVCRSSAIRAMIVTVIGSALLGGCASRTAGEDEVAVARRPAPPAAVYEEPRQSVGASQPVWMDDPAKRRGPQGQPAPYGRDTITGRPLSELQAQGGVGDHVGATPPRGGQPSRVVVGKGDTLSSIARRHNVSVQNLRLANDLQSDRIRAGQTLVIPGS